MRERVDVIARWIEGRLHPLHVDFLDQRSEISQLAIPEERLTAEQPSAQMLGAPRAEPVEDPNPAIVARFGMARRARDTGIAAQMEHGVTGVVARRLIQL